MKAEPRHVCLRVNDLGDGFKMGAIDMDKIKADAAAGADAAKKTGK